MTRQRVKIFKVLFQIISGYIKSLYSVVRFSVVIAFLGGVSIAIIFPLWFLSTSFKEIYTVFTITALCVLCIIYLVLKVIKIIKRNGINEILFKLGKILTFFMCLALLGIILLFYTIFFTINQSEINNVLKGSLFISVLILSIIYIYTISIIREHGFLLHSVYRIIMGCAVAGFAYFIILLLIKEQYLLFICSLILHTVNFGYFIYSRKHLPVKHK